MGSPDTLQVVEYRNWIVLHLRDANPRTRVAEASSSQMCYLLGQTCYLLAQTNAGCPNSKRPFPT